MTHQIPGLLVGFVLGVLAMVPALVARFCNDRPSDGQSDALIGGSEAAAVHDHGDAA
ncbi:MULTISPECIES: hypothetical protein [unclassified Sphingomonas]|uniref:hypothetical protein n=1 Tax=unclassified Sphingomonas TaxID=196159 RepID=UPI002269D204|nr:MULTISPECIES: hypothetical protein [unclassified Sphingomonas]